MASIITSIKDLITSIFEVIFSVFKSAIDTVSSLLRAFFDFFAGIPIMIGHMVKGSLEAAGGVGSFIAGEFQYLVISINELTVYAKGNIVIISLIALGSFGYLAYLRRDGRPASTASKKLR
jgi:phage-related protein